MRTKEGLEIKKLKTFPSMEYGDNGGVTCDIYLNGKLVCNYFDQGNGGCADITMSTTSPITEEELTDICVTATTRIEPEDAVGYTPEIIRAAAIDSLVNIFIDYKDHLKGYKKWAKKYPEGSFQFVVYDNGWNQATTVGPAAWPLKNFIERAKKSNLEYKKILTFKSLTDFDLI